MKVRQVILAVCVAMVAALVVVHFRTRQVTLGYELARVRAERDALQEKNRKLELERAVLTSPAALRQRMAEHPIKLVPPQDALGFVQTQNPQPSENIVPGGNPHNPHEQE